MDPKEIIKKTKQDGDEKEESEIAATSATDEESLHEDDVHHDNLSSLDDVVVDNEKVPLSKRAKEKAKRHFVRFWWCYIIGLVVILLILLPAVFKVIIPNLIKNVVNNQALPIISGAMVFTGLNNLSMALNTSLDTPLGVVIGPVDLALHAVQTEGSDHNESPFVTIHMPEKYVKGKTEVEIPAQTAIIQDDTQLVAWFNNFFESDTTELRVRTDNLAAHIGRLSYTVSMDKTIRVQGLKSLQGFSVPRINLILPAEANGTNIVGTMMIPNAGVLTLSMGNVTFNLWVGNLNVGTITAYDLTLKPGNNTSPFQGQLDTDKLIDNLGAILDSQSEAVSNGYIELNATGNSTFYNGNRITYIEDVLNTKKLRVRFPTSTLVSELLSGVLVSSSGSDSSNSSSLLNDLGNALSNITLLQSTSGNSKEDDNVSHNSSTASSGSVSRVKRAMNAAIDENANRSARTNLLGLIASRKEKGNYIRRL